MKPAFSQPSLEAQRTLGKSSFRFEGLEFLGTWPVPDQQTFVRSTVRFAPVADENLWANRPPAVPPNKRRRRYPIVKASGRIITQQEIDDAMDE